MTEKRITREFATEERFREADTDYLRKHGVKRLGQREVFTIEETETGIQICGGSALKYYFDDKDPEELPSQRACVLFPSDFFPELERILEELILKEAVKKA